MPVMYSIAFVVFWTCAALVVYTYALYPLLLLGPAQAARRQRRR